MPVTSKTLGKSHNCLEARLGLRPCPLVEIARGTTDFGAVWAGLSSPKRQLIGGIYPVEKKPLIGVGSPRDASLLVFSGPSVRVV